MRFKSDPTLRELLLKGEVPEDSIGAAYVAEVTKTGKLGAKSRSFDVIITTSALDRDGDRLDASGWDFKNFIAAGGPVLFGHDAKKPPIGKTPNISTLDARVKASPEFHPEGEYDLADLVVKCMEFGSMKAASVGYLPRKGTFKKNGDGGFDFKGQELLEYSILPVPSNPEALVMVKAAGLSLAPISAWCEEMLDGTPFFAELARVHGITKEAAMRCLKIGTGEAVSVAVAAPGAAAPEVVADPSTAAARVSVVPGGITLDPEFVAAAVVKALREAWPGRDLSKAAPPFPPKDDDEKAEVDCPECGKKMPKGGTCPECGYKAGKGLRPDALARLAERRGETAATLPVDDAALLSYFETFAKCGDVVGYPYPEAPPPVALTFDDIVEKREAEKLSWQAQDLQWTFMDSVRSILAAAEKGDAVAMLRQTLAQYAAALNALEPEKKKEAMTKAGRVFSRANEAMLAELRALMAQADKTLGDLLAQVAPNPTPEGEMNLPAVIGPGPTGGEKVLRIVDDTRPAPAFPASTAVPLRIVATKAEIAELERTKMLATGKLPAPRTQTA